MKRTLVDTNVFIDWLNDGLHEEIVIGTGRTRLLSSVVLLELRAGASNARAHKQVDTLARRFLAAQRLIAPSSDAYDAAGRVLGRLRRSGREVRRASLVNDVLIALTAREHGAVVVTRDRSDFEAIRKHVDFGLEVVA